MSLFSFRLFLTLKQLTVYSIWMHQAFGGFQYITRGIIFLNQGCVVNPVQTGMQWRWLSDGHSFVTGVTLILSFGIHTRLNRKTINRITAPLI